jgi:hypothetical protein
MLATHRRPWNEMELHTLVDAGDILEDLDCLGSLVDVEVLHCRIILDIIEAITCEVFTLVQYTDIVIEDITLTLGR